MFMPDTGARPAEVVGLEHRHVDGDTVELPGRKTEHAWRTVHMTERGAAAVAADATGVAHPARVPHRLEAA
jgi:hypothetical protein